MAALSVLPRPTTVIRGVKLARELHPDIVIMDIAMPNMNGIEATRQIKTELPEIQVIILSMHATKNYVSQVLAGRGLRLFAEGFCF